MPLQRNTITTASSTRFSRKQNNRANFKPVITDELLHGHFLLFLNVGIMCIRVQHDQRECEHLTHIRRRQFVQPRVNRGVRIRCSGFVIKRIALTVSSCKRLWIRKVKLAASAMNIRKADGRTCVILSIFWASPGRKKPAFESK